MFDEENRAFAVRSVTHATRGTASVTCRFPGWLPPALAESLTATLAETLRESPVDTDATPRDWAADDVGYTRIGGYGVTEIWFDCGDWGTCCHVRAEGSVQTEALHEAVRTLADCVHAVYWAN